MLNCKIVLTTGLLAILGACGGVVQTTGNVGGLLITGPTGGSTPQELGLNVPDNAPVRLEFYTQYWEPIYRIPRNCTIGQARFDTYRSRVVIELAGRNGIFGTYYYPASYAGGQLVSRINLPAFCSRDRNWRQYRHQPVYSVTIRRSYQPFK